MKCCGAHTQLTTGLQSFPKSFCCEPIKWQHLDGMCGRSKGENSPEPLVLCGTWGSKRVWWSAILQWGCKTWGHLPIKDLKKSLSPACGAWEWEYWPDLDPKLIAGGWFFAQCFQHESFQHISWSFPSRVVLLLPWAGLFMFTKSSQKRGISLLISDYYRLSIWNSATRMWMQSVLTKESRKGSSWGFI